MAASKSTPEWMASEMTETDPIINPTASLSITRLEFEITESIATFDFRLFFSASLSTIVSFLPAMTGRQSAHCC